MSSVGADKWGVEKQRGKGGRGDVDRGGNGRRDGHVERGGGERGGMFKMRRSQVGVVWVGEAEATLIPLKIAARFYGSRFPFFISKCATRQSVAAAQVWGCEVAGRIGR